jgi:hypothetical protein
MDNFNPFRAKAEAARKKADELNRPTAYEAAFAHAFPTGGGYGRRGGAKRIDARIARATKAVDAIKQASYFETCARLFDDGLINAQGRTIRAGTAERSAKRDAAKQSRDERIAQAKAALQGVDPLTVDPATYATAHGYLGGAGRTLVMEEHAERIARRGENISPTS